MAMNPEDLKLRSGERAPRAQGGQREGQPKLPLRRRFTHQHLAQALAGFGVAKVRTR